MRCCSRTCHISRKRTDLRVQLVLTREYHGRYLTRQSVDCSIVVDKHPEGILGKHTSARLLELLFMPGGLRTSCVQGENPCHEE